MDQGLKLNRTKSKTDEFYTQNCYESFDFIRSVSIS